MRFFLFILLILGTLASAQNNFKTGMLKANPIKSENPFGSGAIRTHEAFLKKAIATKNELNHLYGLLYLHKDYFLESDFVNASNYLLAAEKFSKKSQGAFNFCKSKV